MLASLKLAKNMASSSKSPVRIVLFDVFDTLCTPRLPIHEQYHDEAIKSGLPPRSISPTSVRNAFKPAFKEMEGVHPLYGKHSKPPLLPEEWWNQVIRRTMLHAGAEMDDVDHAIGRLAPALLSRFESEAGYRNFPETLSCLEQLRKWDIKTSIVSNADPRILKTLEALQILALLSSPPTLSWDAEVAKPSREIFDAACGACGEAPGEGVLMVGDELEADYGGATAAGLEGRLIRREGEWSDGAVRAGSEDLQGVHVVISLKDVVDEVARRNGLPSMSRESE